ncbi:CLUMA_CG020667, isoform A [Clunio marinus]|uniref:CLUMA_CG020667, isoform A n=1 Tax=Clunio marinus TaxID=568069 RepID=A0A1J1J9M2_9DIPT|nr:CLUMA_CG020667, isoform A [Clunio marinus]
MLLLWENKYEKIVDLRSESFLNEHLIFVHLLSKCSLTQILTNILDELLWLKEIVNYAEILETNMTQCKLIQIEKDATT